MELLLVMAIIAILAAAVLAALGGVRRSMTKAKATEQSKRLANAFIYYYHTYGRWPSLATPPAGPLDIDGMCLTNLTSKSTQYNPRGILFLDPDKTWTNGATDPWGRPYQYCIAASLDRAASGVPVEMGSAGSSPVAIWSRGPDGTNSATNPRSW